MNVMPPATQRAHFEPAWKGDRFAGIADVAQRAPGRDGIRAIDVNFQWAWADLHDHSRGGTAYALHWPDPKRNNFTRIVDHRTGHVRAMSRAELHRPISLWTAGAVLRWRRTDGDRPRSYREMCVHAVAHGVRIIGELKSEAFALRIPQENLHRSAGYAHHPPWFMALYGSMSKCRQKCAATVVAGNQFAVIFGRFQYLRHAFRISVRTWRIKPTRTW